MWGASPLELTEGTYDSPGVGVVRDRLSTNIQLLPELQPPQSLEMPFNQGLYHPQRNERENLTRTLAESPAMRSDTRFWTPINSKKMLIVRLKLSWMSIRLGSIPSPRSK